jgi:hypothetical protein
VPRTWQVAVFAVLAVVLLGWAVVSAIRGNTYITIMDAVLGLNCVFTVYRLRRGWPSAPVRLTLGRRSAPAPDRAPASEPDRAPVPEIVRARRERRERRQHRLAGSEGRRRRRQ